MNGNQEEAALVERSQAADLSTLVLVRKPRAASRRDVCIDPPVSMPPIPGVSAIGSILIIDYQHLLSALHMLRLADGIERIICESVGLCVKIITH